MRGREGERGRGREGGDRWGKGMAGAGRVGEGLADERERMELMGWLSEKREVSQLTSLKRVCCC